MCAVRINTTPLPPRPPLSRLTSLVKLCLKLQSLNTTKRVIVSPAPSSNALPCSVKTRPSETSEPTQRIIRRISIRTSRERGRSLQRRRLLLCRTFQPHLHRAVMDLN